jgi:hypothetical protein
LKGGFIPPFLLPKYFPADPALIFSGKNPALMCITFKRFLSYTQIIRKKFGIVNLITLSLLKSNHTSMTNKKVDTKIVLSPNNKNKWDILYSNDGGKNFKLHKTFASIEDAMKETTIINGSFRLLNDLVK